MAEMEERLKRLEGTKAGLLANAILAELKLEDLPAPLTLRNPQVIKEPYFLLLYAERKALRECDLEEEHGDDPKILSGIYKNLTLAYSTQKHPLNGWQRSMITLLVGHYRTLLSGYTLIAPLDESGVAMSFEPAHVTRLVDFSRTPREAARRLIEQLDEDFTRKNAGRKAAALVSGARSLRMDLFAPQDAWIYKKASGKAEDTDTPFDDGSFRGGRGGRGSRGGRGGRGARGGRGKRPRDGGEKADDVEE